MTQRELAARMNRPPQVINEIIRAKKAITPETAIGLETALGISAVYWLNLEASYQLTLARNKERASVEENLSIVNEYPLNEMVKLGWLQATRSKRNRLEALAGFFGNPAPQPSAFQEAVGFRMTDAARNKVSLGALAAWLREGEIIAEQVETGEFEPTRFQRTLSRIRSMTEQHPQDYFPKMQSLCAESGVALCVVPELRRSGANGVTRQLSNGKIVVQLNIRGKWADIFWFTFFHEACHVLHHLGQRRVIIQGDAADPQMKGIEDEANKFAADFLIPSQQWEGFASKNDFGSQTITDFAEATEIAPGIVVGRLQKEGLISYGTLNGLKVRYGWGKN